jgi:hypothetical protein
MMEMILAGVAGWLVRGVFSAYRQREGLNATDALKVVVFGGGGPRPK